MQRVTIFNEQRNGTTLDPIRLHLYPRSLFLLFLWIQDDIVVFFTIFKAPLLRF